MVDRHPGHTVRDVPHSNTSPEPDLQEFLFDLDAESKLVRFSAIMHLQRFSQRPEVLDALKRRLETESEDEIRYHLQSIIDPKRLIGIRPGGAVKPQGLVTGAARITASPETSTSPETLPAPEAFDVSTPEALGAAWFAASPDRLPVLLKALQNFPAPTVERVVREWFRRGLDQTRLLLLLDLEPSPFTGSLAGELLKPLLLDRRPVVVLKSLWHLTRSTPGETLEHLPHLLVSPSIPVRVLALRTLHRLWPAEAARLLEEFLANPEPALRSIGLAMLFQFPFEEISFIVLRLLEIPELPRSGLDALLMLVRSNPDRGFLQRVAGLSMTRGDELPALAEVMEAAATALSVAGLESGSPRQIRDRALAAARRRMEAIGSDVPAAASITAPPTAGKATAPVPAKPPGDAVLPSEAERIGQALERGVCDDDTGRLLRTVVERATIDAGLAHLTLRAIATFPLRESPFLRWLETRLEGADEGLILGALNTLEKLDPKRLAAHLPLLCFHSSARVSFQAVRALRKREGPVFLRRIQAWVKDRDPRAVQAAVAGLMQIDFDKARSLILQTLRANPAPELGMALGKILVMNPESRTVWELEAMADEFPKRRDALLALAEACRTAVREISGGGEVGSRNPLQQTIEEWGLDERARRWFDRIRAIRYRTPELEFDPATGRRALVLVFALFAAGFGIFSVGNDSAGSGSGRRGGVPPKVFKRAAPEVALPVGQPVSITLVEFDPIGRQWKVSTPEGTVVKVRFPSNVSGLKAGMRGLIDVAPAGKTTLGYALYAASRWRPLETP